jgi:cyanate permease
MVAVTADPILERRARIARLVSVGQRLGYLLFAIAVVAFFVGAVVDFSDGIVTLIVICLIVGSIILAPAIVFGYAVKAAQRDDAERGL